MLEKLNKILGVDVGGTVTKFGLVNTQTGDVTEYNSFDTPKNTTPDEIFDLLRKHIPIDCSAIGFGLPCIVKNNILRTAPKNPGWIGINFKELAEEYFQISCISLNDADAAAIAEIKFGVMSDLEGVSILITLGTGIGTAIVNDGSLIMNTEFGRMAMPNGIDNAEDIASVTAKNRENLNWEQYAERVNLYLAELNRLYWQDHVVIGGGVSESWEEWFHLLDQSNFEIHRAKMGNKAGIVGAAHLANLYREMLDEFSV